MKKIFSLILVFLLLKTLIIFADPGKAPESDIFILNTVSQTISRLDLSEETIDNSFALTGLFPNRMAVHEGHIYLTNSGDNNIQKIDALSGDTVSLIPVENNSNPYDIVIYDNYAYVTGMITGKVYKIDLFTGNILEELETGVTPGGMLIHNNRLYVANSGFQYPSFLPGELSVIDLQDFSLLATISVPLNPQMMIVDQNDFLHLVCAGNYDDLPGNIVILDTVILEISKTIPLSIFPTKIVLTSQNRVYVTDAFGTGLFAYDLPGLDIVHDCDNLFPYGGSALAVFQDWLIVADAGDFSGNSSVWFFDPAETLTHTFQAAIGAIDIVSLAGSTNIADETLIPSPAISIFPNPFRGQTEISLESSLRNHNQKQRLVIYNLKGQKVREMVIKESSLIWDGTDLRGESSPSGIYLIKISDGKNNYQTAKITLIR